MTDEATWTAVDAYYTDLLVGADPPLDAALAASEAAGLPMIQVSPPLGKLLELLARAIGARCVLEVGTLGGYSTIWLARAVGPDGRVVTLEVDPHHAEVAMASLARAGLADVVDVRVGPALETLPRLAEVAGAPFDLAFVDADKRNNAAYLDWAIRLTRPGGLVVLDNVVRRGAVLDDQSDDPDVLGVRAALELLATDPRVTATAIQTVGSKGYDGFAVALVTG